MSGDPFRAYYREIERQNRRERIRHWIAVGLIVLGTIVASVFVWAFVVLLFTIA